MYVVNTCRYTTLWSILTTGPSLLPSVDWYVVVMWEQWLSLLATLYTVSLDALILFVLLTGIVYVGWLVWYVAEPVVADQVPYHSDVGQTDVVQVRRVLAHCREFTLISTYYCYRLHTTHVLGLPKHSCVC